MSANKLLVVGELNVDLILNQIRAFPKIGTEIVADSMDFTLGSSSAIMASNVSAMGIETSFCGMIGNDDFGTFVLEKLQQKRVNTKFIKQSSQYSTGITVVLNYDQDRANVTYCGAMKALGIDNIPWGEIKDFSHFHLSNFFLQEGIKNDITQIFKQAKQAGLTTSLDLQVDPENQWDFDYKKCLPYVDIFLPNEAEIKALTGKRTNDEALKKLQPFANIIALKMGEKGAMVLQKENIIEAPSFVNKNYKDAIGAGDSFNAGFIEKFIQGESLESCLRQANLMGSLSTTQPGGTGAFLSKEDIEIQANEILKQQT